MAEQIEASSLARPFNPQDSCGLFKLPQELRNRIYQKAFAFQSCHERRLALISKKSSRAIPTILSLLQTCRRIQHEAQSIFYGINCILIDAKSLSAFLRNTSLSRIKYLRHLRIYVRRLEGITAALKPIVRVQGMKINSLEIIYKSRPVTEAMYKRESPFIKKLVQRLMNVGGLRVDRRVVRTEWEGQLKKDIRRWHQQAKNAKKWAYRKKMAN